jgi:hypothetical protein
MGLRSHMMIGLTDRVRLKLLQIITALMLALQVFVGGAAYAQVTQAPSTMTCPIGEDRVNGVCVGVGVGSGGYCACTRTVKTPPQPVDVVKEAAGAPRTGTQSYTAAQCTAAKDAERWAKGDFEGCMQKVVGSGVVATGCAAAKAYACPSLGKIYATMAAACSAPCSLMTAVACSGERNAYVSKIQQRATVCANVGTGGCKSNGDCGNFQCAFPDSDGNKVCKRDAVRNVNYCACELKTGGVCGVPFKPASACPAGTTCRAPRGVMFPEYRTWYCYPPGM